jgi:hypothetical protein
LLLASAAAVAFALTAGGLAAEKMRSSSILVTSSINSLHHTRFPSARLSHCLVAVDARDPTSASYGSGG